MAKDSFQKREFYYENRCDTATEVVNSNKAQIVFFFQKTTPYVWVL